MLDTMVENQKHGRLKGFRQIVSTKQPLGGCTVFLPEESLTIARISGLNFGHIILHLSTIPPAMKEWSDMGGLADNRSG